MTALAGDTAVCVNSPRSSAYTSSAASSNPVVGLPRRARPKVSARLRMVADHTGSASVPAPAAAQVPPLGVGVALSHICVLGSALVSALENHAFACHFSENV